jgi:hypothetical protein
MTSHGGMIGVPAPMQGYVSPHGVQARVAVAVNPMQASAVGLDQHTQAWAYSTPSGLQLVHPGPTPVMVDPRSSATTGAGMRRRIRWETIVPMIALTCLVAAVGVLVADFDQITGRDVGAAGPQPAAAAPAPAQADAASSKKVPAGTDTASDTISQARSLLAKGRFADARNMLRPLVAMTPPNAQAVKLSASATAAGARNQALLRKLATQRRSSDWSGVIATIGALEQVRPLSIDLKKLRGNAIRARRAQAVRRKAALQQRVAAAKAPTRASGPPPAGGQPRPSAGSARPPANVPAGGIPARPDLPNPTGGGGGAAAVGGGPAAPASTPKPSASSTPAGGSGGCTWMVMDGVSMCM